MKKALKIILITLLSLGLGFVGLAWFGLRMMGGKPEREIPLPEARADLSNYVKVMFGFAIDPTLELIQAHQMHGRDGSTLFMLHGTPVQVNAFMENIRQSKWPLSPQEPYSIRTFDSYQREPEVFQHYPAWWRVDTFPDREDLAVTWKMPDPGGSGVHGVLLIFSTLKGIILVSRWTT